VLNGHELWKVRLPSTGFHCVDVAVHDDVVVSATIGKVFGHEVATGRILWTNELGGLSQAKVTLGMIPASRFRGARVVLGTEGYAACLDVKTGHELWHTSLVHAGFGMVTVLVDIKLQLLVAATAGKLFAMDPLTGAILWQEDLKHQRYDFMCLATPMVSACSSKNPVPLIEALEQDQWLEQRERQPHHHHQDEVRQEQEHERQHLDHQHKQPLPQ